MKLLKYFFLIFLFIPICVHASNYEIISGDLDTMGSEVKIADEEFYVIRKEDETHVRLLPKLSLGVGEGVTNQVNKQSQESGVVLFSTTKYWWDENTRDFKSPYLENKEVLGRDNMDDKTYIYDENSLLYPYINNYAEYLKSQGACVTAELIRKDDLFTVGCNHACIRCHGFTYFCYPTYPDWINGNYWIGDAPLYQWHETTDPFESDAAYFSIGGSFFFSQAPVVRVTREDEPTKHTIRPVVILDLNDTCKTEEPEEPEEVIPEENEEKYENPPTGAFISISLLLILIISSTLLFIYYKKKEKFKRI